MIKLYLKFGSARHRPHAITVHSPGRVSAENAGKKVQELKMKDRLRKSKDCERRMRNTAHVATTVSIEIQPV